MTDEAPTDGAPTKPIGRPFQPGNTFGKGNPLARKQAEFRAMFHRAVTADDLAAIAQSMIAEACAGDAVAARLVLEYTAGKPQAALDDSGEDDGRPLLGRMEVRFVPAAPAPVAAAPEPGVA